MMFRILAAVAALALSGCGGVAAPQSEEQIKAELAKLPAQRPGLWHHHEEFAVFTAAGMPEGADEQLRKEFEGRGRLGQLACVAPAEAKSNFEDMLRNYGEASCQITEFRVEGEAFDAALSCNLDTRLEGPVRLSGTLTPERYEARVDVALKLLKVEGATVTYSSRVTDERTGDCTPL